MRGGASVAASPSFFGHEQPLLVATVEEESMTLDELIAEA